MKNALVLFSGGLDSYLTLALSLRDMNQTKVLFFNYGQNTYDLERTTASKICEDKGVDFVELDLTSLSGLLHSSYTSGKEADFIYDSYVPNRNLIFFTLAHNYAYINGFNFIYSGIYQNKDEYNVEIQGSSLEARMENITGVFSTSDVTITPHSDQSIKFQTFLKRLLQESNASADIDFIFPVTGKLDTLKNLYDLSELEYALKNTYSCYSKDFTVYKWGRGCGECSACQERRKAWLMYKHNRNADKT